MNTVESSANTLLRFTNGRARELIARASQQVKVKLHEVLYEPDDTITHVYFPENSIVSLTAPLVDGGSPELASIGREGVVGCIAAVGSRRAYSQWIVQGAGSAYKCPVPTFETAFNEDGGFRQLIVCYMEALLTQTMQSVACNAIHPVEARCARWILIMRDRNTSNRLSLTQEFLAQLLSVHRSSVALALATLQQAGFIKVQRGSLIVLDREGLESAACECYGLVRTRYEELLPGTFAQ